MPGTDLALLTTAALAAGDVARRFFQSDVKHWDKADDAGPVTEADLAVNDLLETQLRSARPDYGWLSEETTDGSDRLNAEHVFIIDPIDGTRSFIKGANTWAHSLAIARRGQVTAAVVYLPIRDMMFTAQLGGGTYLNNDALRSSKSRLLGEADILAAKPTLDPKHWAGDVPSMTRHHRPSLAYRLGLIAKGRFDGMLTLRPSWEWDIAAGALLVSEAGGTITDKAGKGLVFNNPTPLLNGVVAAGPDIHRQLLSKLAPA